MIMLAPHRAPRHFSALFVLSSLVACGTLPVDELGESYPVGVDAAPESPEQPDPSNQARWPGDDAGRVSPDTCGPLACGGQSCSDGICNALSWRMQLHGAYDGELGGIAMTPEGDVVIAGSFSGSIDGPKGSVVSQGDRDVFVAKLAWSGEILWLRAFGDTAGQRATTVFVEKGGQIAIGGELSGAMSADEVTLTSAAQEDGFLLVLDENGHARWGRTFGDAVGDDGDLISSEHQTVHAVAYLPNEHIVVAGTFYGDVAVGEHRHTATGQDGFVAYLRPDGVVRWSRALAGAGDASPTALTVDENGRIIVTGAFSGEVKIDGSVASAGGEDPFVAAMDLEGSELWLRGFGGPGSDRAASVAVDNQGSLFVTGTFGDSMIFDDAGVVAAGEGGGDGFVARFWTQDGGFEMVRTFGDGMHQHPTALSVAPEGDVAVVGWFTGSIDVGLGPMAADEEDAFVSVFGKHDFEASWAHRYGPGAGQQARAATHRHDGALVFAGEYIRAIDLGWGPLGSDDLERKIFVAAVEP